MHGAAVYLGSECIPISRLFLYHAVRSKKTSIFVFCNLRVIYFDRTCRGVYGLVKDIGWPVCMWACGPGLNILSPSDVRALVCLGERRAAKAGKKSVTPQGGEKTRKNRTAPTAERRVFFLIPQKHDEQWFSVEMQKHYISPPQRGHLV